MDWTVLFEKLPEVLANLPEHPIALLGLIILVVGLGGIAFFWRDGSYVKLFVFVLIFLGAGGVALSVQEADPRPRLAFDFLPSDTNILLFNSSEDEKAASRLRDVMIAQSDLSNVEVMEVWKNSWVMQRSRIYYQSQEFQEVALRLRDELPGLQYVFDARRQDEPEYSDPSLWSDNGGIAMSMEFDDTRDLVVFVGNDVAEEY